MKKQFQLNRRVPLWRDAEDFLLKIEHAVVRFPRKFKYSLGQELRQSAMMVCLLIARAWHLHKQSQRVLHKLVVAQLTIIRGQNHG